LRPFCELFPLAGVFLLVVFSLCLSHVDRDPLPFPALFPYDVSVPTSCEGSELWWGPSSTRRSGAHWWLHQATLPWCADCALGMPLGHIE
jgi:hypothetical protein